MAIATGSQSSTSMIVEATYGVNPIIADASTTVVPRISDGANLTKAAFEDPSIYADRQNHFFKQGNREVSGDLTVAYAHEVHDNLLESLFKSTWAANVLLIGNTVTSYTYQVAHFDILQYRMFTGMVPSAMSLEVNLDGIVQNTFSMMGADMELVDATTVAPSNVDETPIPAANKEPFVHLDGTFQEGGINACLTGITLNIENGTEGNYCLGSDVSKELTSSTVVVSGQLTAYFEDNVLYDKFLNGTPTSITFTLDDGLGNTHLWTMPNVIYSGAEVTVPDANQLPITLDFIALYDAGIGSAISITRTV